jgi:UDP-N-acetylglucosamine acyltransferase
MKHELSFIHPDAKIADNAQIEQFVSIGKDVEIGEGTWIGPNAVIMDGARIGKNCKIFPGAIIAAIPQDLKFAGEETTVTIGDNTTVREFVTINRGTKAKGSTIVGDDCLLQSYSHVAHDCIIKNSCILGSYAGLAGEVEVDDFAIISPGSLVHQFVRIGCHVFIQGSSKVGKDVPPYVLAGRDPLAYSGINSVGLRRRNFKNETIYEIQEIYRIIYQRGMNISDALSFIETSLPATDERDEILLFIKDSKRGIIRGYFDEDK